MTATIDQDLVPNAISEFHLAKDHGKSDGEAWAVTVARIRYDVIRLAIVTLAVHRPFADGDEEAARIQCIHELRALQGEYEGEPES